MVGNSGTWRIPPGFWHIVLVTIMVTMLCLAAGCTGSSGNAKNAGPGTGGSGGGSSGSGSSGGGGSGGGSGASMGSDETETSTWQATVSGRENVRTTMAYVDKFDPKSSKSEETTSTLQFQGSFPVVVEHQKDYTGKDIYKRKFVEGGAEYPVSGSHTEQTSEIAHEGYAGCHPMASYTFDFDEQGTIAKTSFDFGFYPDGKMVQLDGSIPTTTHSKGVSSDGKCDHDETGTGTAGWWLQCHSEDEDAEGTAFDHGTRDFRMDGTSYVINCHATIVKEMKDDDSVIYTSPSSITRELTMKVILDPVPPAPKKLKANPGGPYTTERGTPLQLDGSKSTGSITKYTWTFSPGTGCPAGLSLGSAELTGSQQAATFLCPVTAKLTVTDGKDTDSASVPVSVTPRSWETPFKTSGEGFDTGDMATPPWYNSLSGKYEGGANICGPCEGTADESSNLLHPPPKGGSWETGGGYEIAKVEEPDKPFDGYWYVAKYEVEMNRKTVVNPNILPLASGGKELPYGMGNFYQHNLDAKYDIDGYLAGIRKHEKDHTDRMKQALRSADPAKEIEKIVEKDKDAVKKSADTKLHDTEKLVCQKSSDASQPPMAKTWTGKLLFPTADTNQWKEGAVDVGGYRKDAGESCG
jgi:hypothetical protein